MDILTALGGIGSAFGLSTSAGLNAYIPLLIVSLASRFPSNQPLLQLNAPYDIMGSWWVIGLLAVLLLVEVLVDKIPAVDTVNDLVQTFIRPAAGAILFAANADIITDVSPILALGCGLLVAGGVHMTKGAARPVVTASTAGTGNWFVSLLEDIAAVAISILAILIPIILTILILGVIVYFVLFFWRRRQKVGKPAY
jgi:hypothetical protein